MRADSWQFKLGNLLIAGVVVAPFWHFFREHLNDLLFLIPFYWITHSRDVRSRLRELNDRLKLQHDLLGIFLTGDRDPFNLDPDYEALLDAHGFYDEADALYSETELSSFPDDEDDDLPRT